jgi:GH15 family glucan-1,4-alpha-glucosidase
MGVYRRNGPLPDLRIGTVPVFRRGEFVFRDRKAKKISVDGKQKKLPLHGQRIEDYALIGDRETAALVARNGSIDWLCWPNFSSGACFAALLGTADHGYWKIAPIKEVKRTSRRYLDESLVVETTFETASGTVVMLDFMPPRGENSDVVRIVRCTKGKVAMRMELVLRFDYGRSIPWVTRTKDGIRAISGGSLVLLRTARG